MAERREPIREEELDVVGACFGIKVIKREARQSDLIELYVEDDGWWHFKQSFAAFWLNDLLKISIEAMKKANTEIHGKDVKGETDGNGT